MVHIPVLKDEVLKAFEDVDIKRFIDATIGAGGHSAALLAAHPELVELTAIDQDPAALEIASQNLAAWSDRINIAKGNFSQVLKNCEKGSFDGILMDLGVSSMQLDRAEKGFSFRYEGPLDMRMDPSNPLTAESIINCWSEGDLGRLFRIYGEEKRWRIAARAIVRAREQAPITTTIALAELMRASLPKKRGGREIDPSTLVFQALRLKVNSELEVLEEALPLAIDLLRPGGRLAVISFHSLEDRIVKNTFRFAASDKYDTEGIGGLFRDKEPTVKLITGKPLIAGYEELESNPRCRSAKLRVIEKR